MESIKQRFSGEYSNILDTKNSKLSSFLEETNLKEIKKDKLILTLNNGNTFIKKVLETDKQIIIDTIKEVCEIIVDIEIISLDVDKKIDKRSIDKENEKDHPLLDDAIKIFNGKIIS